MIDILKVAPDYLRTKPDPDVEARHLQVEARAAQANPDTTNVKKNVYDLALELEFKSISNYILPCFYRNKLLLSLNWLTMYST